MKKGNSMRRLLLPVVLLISLVLTGCVTQRYAGIRITSTGTMSMTEVMLKNNDVVICNIDQ